MNDTGRDSMGEMPTRPSRNARRISGSPWFWVAIVLVAFATPLAGSFWRSRHPPVPTMWQLPAWQLTNQDGNAFGSRELAGRVYIANFIFTTCALECPRLTREMGHLLPMLEKYGDRVHLVSISVDPQNDTPPRLREYMARYHADPHRWTFVTGPADAVMRAVTEGFRVGVQQAPQRADGTFDPLELVHSNRFALVDVHGRLRRTYVADADGMHELARDLPTVLDER